MTMIFMVSAEINIFKAINKSFSTRYVPHSHPTCMIHVLGTFLFC